MTLRHLLFAVLTLPALLLPLAARAAAPLDPSQATRGPDDAVQKTTLQEKEKYAHKFAEMVLAIIQDPKKSFSDRKGVLRDAFSKSVDIDWIARFVLGSGWNKATDEQREQYMKTYRKYLTETYVANFAENPDKRIADIKVHNVYDSSDDDFTVRTEMMLANQDNLEVQYLVNESEGHYRVRDIAIEKVSLITTHRAELSQLAAARGVDFVIEELKQRLERMQNQQASFSIHRSGGTL